MPRAIRWRILKLVGIYGLLAGLWIYLSDRLILLLTSDPDRLRQVETLKGWFFVASTAALLGWLLFREFRERDARDRALRESEETYRTLFELESDALFLIDNTTGQLIAANPAAARLYGYTPAELLRLRNTDLSAEPAETERVATETPIAPETTVRIPLRYHRKRDGTVFPIEITGRFFIWRGRPVHLAAVRDITERHRAERALWASERRYQHLLATAREGICTVDATGTLTFANAALADMLGYTPAEMIGRPYLDFVDPLHHAEVTEALRQRQTGASGQAERLLRHKDGTPRITLAAGSPILDETGASVGTFGLFTDITARKQAEEALARRTRHLEAVQAIGEEITRELDPPHLLDLILARAMELVGTGSGTLYRWDEAARVLVPATSRGLGDWYRSVRLELGQGVAGTVAQRRDALVVNDLPASPYVLPQLQALHPEAAEVRTSLGVPLLYQDRLLGVLLVRDKHTGEPFGEADVQILRLLAPAAAIAIENAHLYSVAQTHARQLARLTTLTRTLAAQLVPEQAIAEILAAVPALLPGAAARLRQRIGAGTEFRVAGTIGLRDAEAGAQGTVSAAEGLLRLAFASRTPIAATDVATDPDFAAKDWAVREGVVSALVVPLLRGDELVGSLGVLTHERHAFSDGEVALFQALADHAAIALENARLFDELNHSYGRLQQAQTELIRTEKLRALGQMGAGIAHDLNNMLAAILGQLDLLRLQVRDPQILEGLRTLETAATDGAKVVRRLQDFGRQRGQVPLAPVELETVVREALEMTRPRWRDEVQRQGHAIRVEARLEGLPPALSYAPELREALINLILNAVDAMPKGGSLRFAGRAAQQDGTAWVVLEVEDTGIGMTEAIRERIFDPFFTTKGPQGTGLGLSVVYGILERHGGRIDVVSAPGRGTTFTLRLRAAGSAASSQAEPGPAGSALSRRVLLIDDDPMVRETIAGLLRAGGHIVTEAGGGAEGLRTLADGIPDIVITDLGMPELTGWDVARKIKAAHPKLPIILLTGWGEQARDDSSADARAQVDRILGKPVRLDDLLRAVGQLCGIE